MKQAIETAHLDPYTLLPPHFYRHQKRQPCVLHWQGYMRSCLFYNIANPQLDCLRLFAYAMNLLRNFLWNSVRCMKTQSSAPNSSFSFLQDNEKKTHQQIIDKLFPGLLVVGLVLEDDIVVPTSLDAEAAAACCGGTARRCVA